MVRGWAFPALAALGIDGNRFAAGVIWDHVGIAKCFNQPSDVDQVMYGSDFADNIDIHRAHPFQREIARMTANVTVPVFETFDAALAGFMKDGSVSTVRCERCGG